ncbi:MAG: TetR/AcrR family transcriptional regulator [Gammaproteobacteria bacterium]|nr:TetR/AcrR family transcriptional regulator [Gammaproteobacteria bacterium]MDH5729850.1 TetR/AcrR family transcriptional regulator [Gammaproteobacteria bacterium]
MATIEQANKNRGQLNKENILLAAMALINQDGIKTLSMRKLAQAMDVGTMSLYNHVANKNELLDGLLDKVLSEIEIPLDEQSWKNRMRKHALSARQVFTNYRWAIDLMGTELNQGMAQVKYANRVLQCLRLAGFSPAKAIQISSLIDSYIYGFVQKERTRPFKTTEGLVNIAQSAMLETSLENYPYVLEAMRDLLTNPSQYNVDQEFENGLDLILDGLEKAM